MHRALDLASVRQREFGRLDATGSVYLDYTGAAVYPESLVCRDARRLTTRVFGNPHSESSPSLLSTGAAEEARRLTLRLLDASPDEYQVIFTANATGAMRILADAFPFRAGSRLVMTADNHNSVNGLGVSARRRRAQVAYVPLDHELRSLEPTPWLAVEKTSPSLFAFPAQSNFSGVQHPLHWVQEAQAHGYHVLLDAAGYAPTNSLSLGATPVDFLALSYYKLFGYPTGVGALVARRDALATLRRGYFSGGTVQFVSVQNRLVRLKEGAERFEDGTINFLSMPAVCDGLNWLQALGMESIRSHVSALTGLLLKRLTEFGDRVRVYGPPETQARGGTVSFNLYRDGQVIPYEAVEAAARGRGIALRGGCFCNPGASERAFNVSALRSRNCLRGEFTIPRLRACLGETPVGAVRASIGVATNSADLDALIDFIGDETE